MNLTAVYKRDGDWWVRTVAEIPGAHTQGATLQEARENLKDAVKLVMEANRELARPELEDPSAIREEIEIA